MRSEVIGRYHLAPGSRGLEVRRASSAEAARVAAAAAAIAVVAVVVLRLRGSVSPNVVVAGLAAACLVAFAVFTRLDRTVWHASTRMLSREGFAGSRTEWPTTEIEALEIRHRRGRGPEVRRSTAEPWEVRVRLVGGASLGAGFSLVSREQAETLAGVVGEALDRPVL